MSTPDEGNTDVGVPGQGDGDPAQEGDAPAPPPVVTPPDDDNTTPAPSSTPTQGEPWNP